MMKRLALLFAWVCSCKIAFVSSFLPSSSTSIRDRRRGDVGESTRLSMSIPNPLDTLTSGLASIARLPNGVTVDSGVGSSAGFRMLRLYDIENSRECRSVRERITELDLVVERVIPAAPNSCAVKDPGFEYPLPAGATVPTLVASLPNGEEAVLSGEEDILYFFNEYMTKTKPPDSEDVTEQILSVLNTVGSYLAGYLRPGRGEQVSPAATSSTSTNRPAKPLVLYSYEGNQFCRLVREVLTELDIVYELRSAGKESPRRQELAEKTGGSTQCPYIIDPNTGVAMAESADIIQYLYDTYALWTPPNELLEWASGSVMGLFKPIFSKLAPIQAGSNQEDSDLYQMELRAALAEIEAETLSNPVVVYTYDLSPFSTETKALLEDLKVNFNEISLGKEWLPGLLAPGGAIKRAALLEMTGQSSLPHIFVGGKPIGGLFSGNPGLLPSLREGEFLKSVENAKKQAAG